MNIILKGYCYQYIMRVPLVEYTFFDCIYEKCLCRYSFCYNVSIYGNRNIWPLVIDKFIPFTTSFMFTMKTTAEPQESEKENLTEIMFVICNIPVMYVVIPFVLTFYTSTFITNSYFQPEVWSFVPSIKIVWPLHM